MGEDYTPAESPRASPTTYDQATTLVGEHYQSEGWLVVPLSRPLAYFTCDDFETGRAKGRRSS
jgi:hypothetical protein